MTQKTCTHRHVKDRFSMVTHSVWHLCKICKVQDNLLSYPLQNSIVQNRNTFVKTLREFHASGIQVSILTSEENSQTDYLKSLGLYVKIVPKLSLSSCVIDKSTVWYGSINILGYVTEEDNIIKITDVKLANELLDVIYNSGK